MPSLARRTFLWICFLALLAVTPAMAQVDGKGPEPTAADTAPGPDAKKPPETLLELIVAGGALNIGFMAVLGLFSLVGVAVILERLLNLTSRKLMPAGFVRELQERLRAEQDDPAALRELCRRYPSPIASILNAGLLRAGRSLPEVEKAMEDTAAREMAGLRSRVRPLAVLASVAPLVGLLGTVVGMILAFRTASQAGLGKAELLAEGIYLALETTVAGLVIAIPAQLCAAYFYGKTEKYLRRMDEQLLDTIPMFSRLEKTDARRQSSSELATVET